MKKNTKLNIALVLLLLCLSGCGYTTRSLLPSRLKTIHVEKFENKIVYGSEKDRRIYLPLLEVKITNATVDRFLFDGNLKIDDTQTADLILKGELLNYRRDPLRYFDDTQEVQEYRINIIVKMELWDTEREELLWSEPNFIGETTYFTSGSLAKSETVALEDALTDLARRIVERTIENW